MDDLGGPWRLRSIGRRAALSLVLIGLLIFGALAVRAVAHDLVAGGASQPAGVDAEVSPASRAAAIAIPRSFLGLSTEYWTLPVDERHPDVYRRILALLHVPGDGRLLLRIGGNSSDHAIWNPGRQPLQRWAFGVDAAWIARAATVVRANHLRVILDLNSVTASPIEAASWALEAELGFPPGSIVGFEIGNEPDLYRSEGWNRRLRGTGFRLGALPAAMTASSYAASYRAYATALTLAAPGIRLLGPALADPRRDRGWVATLLHEPHPGLAAVTLHEYPYNACAAPGRAGYPTVAKLLRPAATQTMASALAHDVRLAHAHGLPARVTEFNSVTCGGVPGVSDTFATALWAPGALFALARAGVASADLHARVFSVNAPFRFTAHGISARPLLYGLALFARMLGPRSRLVSVRVRTTPGHRLTAWAVRQGSRTLRVLLTNAGTQPVTTRLRLPGSGVAAVQRLLAPSAWSRSGVTLAGQQLDAQARWIGRRVVQTVHPHGGAYTITVRRQSAAMVTVMLPAR
jgi:hypothetical protein